MAYYLHLSGTHHGTHTHSVNNANASAIGLI